MRVFVEAFSLPKAGNALDEYEDAFFPRSSSADAVDRFRFAIADGATETSFSEPWARLLVRSYCHRSLDPMMPVKRLQRLEQVWKRYVGNKPLPWYAEQKMMSGAFAAFAGMELLALDRSWRGYACGDCCIFQARGDSLLVSFPLDNPEQFNDRPVLLSSVAANNIGVAGGMKHIVGTWQPGDTFLLMSDALAAWFLTYSALPATDAINLVTTIKTQGEFEKLVDLFRADCSSEGRPLLRNDDVTLLMATVT